MIDGATGTETRHEPYDIYKGLVASFKADFDQLSAGLALTCLRLLVTGSRR